jgi:glycerophosphoryl diester phosphodiesterase
VKRVELECHRTANRDVPENTLESLEQAALLGCDVVELDLRRTLDGQIVLNHDGVLEHLTDGFGEAEETYYGDLELRDVGSWMGARFGGMRVPLFVDALRMARQMQIRLILDMKTQGMGSDVLALLRQERMLDRVRFNGEWADVKQLYPQANPDEHVQWVEPGITANQVEGYHRAGQSVMANFSTNVHDVDFAGMQAAVAAGVDGLTVDYPRLGADAVGRPVEQKIQTLIEAGDAGESQARCAAILELARYRGFPLQDDFVRWMADSDDHVSRAAALALVTARPRMPLDVLARGLRAQNADARANAAWALGQMHAPASLLLGSLHDTEPAVLREVLLALSRATGEVPGHQVMPLLRHDDYRVRGAAALALAKHDPQLALRLLPERLQAEVDGERDMYQEYVRRGRGKITPEESAGFMSHFAAQIKIVEALGLIPGDEALRELERVAFQPAEEFDETNAITAAFNLWDRIGAHPEGAMEALGSSDRTVADRAEWVLVKGGAAVLPAVRAALDSKEEGVRIRAIHIVAWQGDAGALNTLRQMETSQGSDVSLAKWATARIEQVHPRPKREQNLAEGSVVNAGR